MGGGGEPADAKRERKEARQRARREQIKTGQEQASAMTQDFNSAFGRPSLFNMRKAIIR